MNPRDARALENYKRPRVLKAAEAAYQANPDYFAPASYPGAIEGMRVALAEAVADREGLAEVIRVAQNVPFVGRRQYQIADAVIQWLTGKDTE